MISFVWPYGEQMLAGTGGSETYTAGHVRELNRRGINAQVVTIGNGTKDGRQDFPDIPFLALKDESEIGELPGTVVFVNRSYGPPTKNKSFIILHCSIPPQMDKVRHQGYIEGKTVIATSIYSGQQWALYLNIPYSRMNIVLPFADPVFGNVKRAKTPKKTRILFAGRLHPDKGIYTILEMMHEDDMHRGNYSMTFTMAGQYVPIGREIARMLKDYPYARLIEPQKSVAGMAKLLAKSDILLMPSVFAEPFGMLSVEAQHAGCRVVASNVGGLPETNGGLLTLVEPRNPRGLVMGIKQAVALGQPTARERARAVKRFTLHESVDDLLKILRLKTK